MIRGDGKSTTLYNIYERVSNIFAIDIDKIIHNESARLLYLWNSSSYSEDSCLDYYFNNLCSKAKYYASFEYDIGVIVDSDNLFKENSGVVISLSILELLDLSMNYGILDS